MKEIVREYVNRFGMISAGEQVVVGLSGGADSVCLLLTLCDLAKEMDFGILAVHVNHGIRGEAASLDEEFAKTLCEREGVAFQAVHFEVPRIAKERGESEEEAGRHLRREAFEQIMRESGAKHIALAHHRDDNAETFLMNLARGTRLKGLCGIRPVNGVYIHPLLCVGRTDIEADLARRGQNYCSDETNLENAYTRNKLRNEVLPYFRREINARTSEHIDRAASQLSEIADFLGKAENDAAGRCFASDGGNVLILADAFDREEPLIQNMLIRRALCITAGREKDLEDRHVRAVAELFAKQCGRKIDLPYGMRAVRTYEGIMIETFAEEGHVPEVALVSEGGVIRASYGDWEVRGRIFPAEEIKDGEEPPKKAFTKWFDYDIIKNSLLVRGRQSGDVIVTCKEGRPTSLKKFFVNEKVKEYLRDRIPLVADDSEILWVVGYRQSMAYRITEETKYILELTFREKGREMEA